MNKIKITFLGFVIWLVAAFMSVGSFLGANYAIAMLKTWELISMTAFAVTAVGVIIAALTLDPVRKYFRNLTIVRATQLAGITGGVVALVFAFLLFTTDPLTAELGTSNLIVITAFVSSLLIGIFLILLSLIQFAGRHNMKEFTTLPGIGELAMASGLMNAIAGLIIISEIAVPSNMSIFILIPALILDSLLFYKLSYFE